MLTSSETVPTCGVCGPINDVEEPCEMEGFGEPGGATCTAVDLTRQHGVELGHVGRGAAQARRGGGVERRTLDARLEAHVGHLKAALPGAPTRPPPFRNDGRVRRREFRR